MLHGLSGLCKEVRASVRLRSQDCNIFYVSGGITAQDHFFFISLFLARSDASLKLIQGK